MKKLWVLITLCAASVSLPAHADHHVPEAASGTATSIVELDGRVALMLTIERFNPLLEIHARLEDRDLEFRYRSLTLGSYYRIHSNIKLGLFYRLQQGARHDDDWINLNPGWAWADTRERFENVLIFDFSPRFLLDFLPGWNWVLMLKSRYLFNTFNLHHSILLRPGLTFFLLHDREPLFNFSFNYSLYFALNFGNTPVYEHWPYLTVLFHLSPNIKLELTGSYRSVIWSTSQDIKDTGAAGYSINYNAFSVGLGVLFAFDL